MGKHWKSSNKAFPSSYSTAEKWICVALLCGFSLGCGSHRRVVQLQSENERLLAEFRSQRDQNKDLAQKNAVLEARVAESEKMLAQINRSNGSRLSMLDRSSRLPDAVSPTNRSGPSNQPGRALQTTTSGDTSSEPQWKPVRK